MGYMASKSGRVSLLRHFELSILAYFLLAAASFFFCANLIFSTLHLFECFCHPFPSSLFLMLILYLFQFQYKMIINV